ncbi:MAG: hypothetical protein E7612_09210 [Ruminococcaceae bacterium]|nr:hypothetical protein [Oscillospiraceae bacterium]
MLGSKKFKIILIIFAVITAVGVTAGLLGSLSSSDDGPVIKDSHEHEFEVISSVPGTCTTPGSETLRCKTCFYKETRETETNNIHNYSKYQICVDCGFTEHELLLSTADVPLDEEAWEYYQEIELDNSTCSFVLISTSPTSCELMNVSVNTIEPFEFFNCNYLAYEDGVLIYSCSDPDAFQKCSIYKFNVTDDMSIVRAPGVNEEFFTIKSDNGFIDSGEWLLNPAFIEITVSSPSILDGDYDFSLYEIRKGVEEKFHIGTFDHSQTTIRTGNFSKGITYINMEEELNAPTLTLYFETYSDWLSLEMPDDVSSCPVYLLPDEFISNSYIFSSDEPLYMRSEYLTFKTYYIALSKDISGDINLPESGVTLVEELIMHGQTFCIYKITEDCTISIWVSV